ncbi:unnamed protein product [Cochlearia groenlandica]
MAISQLMAPCLRNLVAAILAAKELGFEMTPECFDEITTTQANASLPDRFFPVVPFPEQYTRYKDQLRRKTEVPWAEVLEQQKRYWCSLRESWSLGPQERFSEPSEANEDTMDESEVPSLFVDEENQNPEEGVRPTPAAVLENASARTRSSGDGENPRVKRARVERSIDAGSAAAVGSEPAQIQTAPEGSEVGARAALGDTGDENAVNPGVDVVRGDGVEEEPRIADITGVDASDATGEGFSSSSLPYFKGGEFSFKLDKDNLHKFFFDYEGEGAFLNNEEACAGFNHLLVESHDECRPPASLVYEAEIASLARLEQRVAYRRTKLAYDYERRFASSEEAKAAVEKERDEARAEVEDLKKALRLAKREKRVQKLKVHLEEVELDRTKIKGELELASSLLQDRDSELVLSRKAEADLSGELGLLRKRYEDMVVRDGHEFARLRRSRSEYVDAARDQFARLHEESRSKLAKLKAYLAEQEAKKQKFLLWNQLKGIFDTLKTMDQRYGVAPTNDFVEVLRKRKAELEAWLALRPKLSYAASDFELPDELGVASVPEVSSRDESGRIDGESSRCNQGDGDDGGDDDVDDAADELAED